ncbi:MAG: PAS domain-containing protein [Epsilonproteobacteria bacterium]|nr:PAS domain-containing protein [Campylobacterota bacterium]
MHSLLKQQLKQLSIQKDEKSIDNKQFRKLLKQISKTYQHHDTQYYNLLSSTHVLQTVFQEATEGIIIEDDQRKVIHVNTAMGRILHTSPDALLGQHSDFLSSMIDEETKANIYAAMETKGCWQGEVEIHPNPTTDIYC